MAIYVPQIINTLTSTSVVDGLAANQGRVLNEQIGTLANLETEAKEDTVVAINELKENLNDFVAEIDAINGEIV